MSTAKHPHEDSQSAPEAFRGAQQDLVARGAGLLAIAGGVTALLLMPFFPPTVALGTVGFVLVLPGSVLSIVFGTLNATLKVRPSPRAVYASSFNGILQIALLQWLAGGGSAPYMQMLLLPVLGACAAQSVRRCVPVLIAAALAAISPLLYSTIDVAATVTELGLLTVTSLMISAVITSTRTHRARLKDAGEYANQLAHVDPLTGLSNRRAFDETLAHGIEASRLTGTPMSLLLCDVNSFKHVNDTLGHQAGDRVLQSIATALSGTMRGPDAAFRWAGDEFAVILSDADGVGASRMAARVRDAVRLHCARETGCVITIGTGVAELQAGMTADELIAEADAALFENKAQPIQAVQSIDARGAAA
jgi:diguanylate cyclase (GGDEF)-like protein